MIASPSRAPAGLRATACRILAIACLAQTASCAGSGEPRVRYLHHTGTMTSTCNDLSQGQAGLSIVDKPGEGVVTILNANRSDFRFYYDSIGSFGDYQMFYIRFRDSSGKVIPMGRTRDCGWFSPKSLEANLYDEGEWPPRRMLLIPARGSIAIKREFADFLNWGRFAPQVEGPCQVQFRLLGYSARRTWETIEADSRWGPGPCPGSSRQ